VSDAKLCTKNLADLCGDYLLGGRDQITRHSEKKFLPEKLTL
jgi:hypothetical protein